MSLYSVLHPVKFHWHVRSILSHLILTTVLHRRWRSHFTDEKTVGSERAKNLSKVTQPVEELDLPQTGASSHNLQLPPNGWLWKFLHRLQGLSTVKMLCCLWGRKRFSFKHKVTIAFPSFPFFLLLWLEGNKCSSNINRLCAFLQLTPLSLLMSSVLSKLKTRSGKAARVQGHLWWACPRLRSRQKKHALGEGIGNFGPLSQQLAPTYAGYLTAVSRCQGALWWAFLFLIKVI